MSVRSEDADLTEVKKDSSTSHSPPAAASTPSSPGHQSEATPGHGESAPPPTLTGTHFAPQQEEKPEEDQSEDDVESDEDQEEDLEAPGWDGIRRRKRQPGHTRIRPAYYYPRDPSVSGPSAAKKGSRGVPVFEPTMDEFRDFYEYVQKIDKYGMRSGIVKVVPPKEWIDALPNEKELLKQTRIRSPIAEMLHGSAGLFRQTNITKSRHFNAKQWKDLSETPKFAMPDFFGTGDPVELAEARRAGKRDQSKAAKAARAAQKEASEGATPGSPATPRSAARKADDAAMEEDELSSVLDPADDVLMAASPAQKTPANTPDAATTSTESTSQPAAKRRKSGGRKAPLSAAARAEIVDAEWQDFDYKSMMHGLNVEHFTAQHCSDVEKRYWRTLTFGEPPMYGADLEGSLFTEQTKSWNVADLQDMLKRMCPHSLIPGVTQPYLYFGMWRATFSWHVEDADLYSINYVHFGAPKFWYSVPQAQSQRFERVMANFFPTDRKRCSEFLRHKSYLASPKKLADQGITLNRCVQHAGEFIITYPKGYHSGFNVGFNCAESINFATERWLEYGKQAKACKCVADSVRLDVEGLLADARRDALTDPSIRDAIPPRYRDGPVAPEPDYMVPSKRVKLEQPLTPEEVALAEQKKLQRAATKATKDAEAQAAAAKQQEKMRLEQQAQSEALARKNAYVCCLCPETSRVSLVKLGKSTTGKAGKERALGHAHKLCAMFVPETSVDFDPETGEEVVLGVESVEKARWNLKCQVCSDKHGAKIQCVKGKCSKAYHVTCATKEASGAFLDAVIGEGPTAINLISDARKDGLSALDVFAVAPPGASDEMAAESAPQAQPPPSPAKSLVQKAQDSHPEALQSALGSSSHASQPEMSALEASESAGDVDPMDSMRHVLLCRLHNPEWLKLKSEKRLQQVWDQAQSLALDSTIKVKTTGGIFAVTLVGFLPEKKSVQVVFENGKQAVYKTTAIFWTESQSSKAAVPQKRSESMSRSRSASNSTSLSSSQLSSLPSSSLLTTSQTGSSASNSSAAPSMHSHQPSAPSVHHPPWPFASAPAPHTTATSATAATLPPQGYHHQPTTLLPPDQAVLPPPRPSA